MCVNIDDLFAPGELQAEIDAGYVSVQKHPDFPGVHIFNYTPAAQYEQHWTDVTTQCRGLIAHSKTGEVIARPFGKFFNYGEVIDKKIHLPAGDPIVTEKMDGSLGIIYTYGGQTAVATRGSFASDQALWATRHLRVNYPNFTHPEGATTLVEIIYPENRIVVDYEGAEGLWLLGAIDNATGADILLDDIDWWTGPRTPQHGILDIDTAVALGVDDEYKEDEGVVLCWPRSDAPSVRLKVKHPRYVKLHRVVTNLSTRSVHEALATDTFDELLEVVPDEFHPWLREVSHQITVHFDQTMTQAHRDLHTARVQASDRHPDVGYTRPLLAEYVKDMRHPGLCFALEDGKDISARVWDMVRPEREMATAQVTD